MSRTNPRQIRKAAILVGTMDGETAAGLLAQLTPEEAREVRMAVQSLGSVDGEERADVLAEFRRAAPAAAENRRDAVQIDQIDPSLWNAEPGEHVREEIAPHTTGTNGAEVFGLFDDADAEQLAPYLAREQAQTVAIILSHLKPKCAANVLATLPQCRQTEVLERLSELGEADPESLKAVASELAAWAGRRSNPAERPAKQRKQIADILAAAPPRLRETWIAQLTRRNGQAAHLVDAFRINEERDVATARQVEKPDEGNATSKLSNATPSTHQIPPRSTIGDGGDSGDDDSRHIRVTTDPLPTTSFGLFPFSQLSRLDAVTFGAVVRAVDPQVLVLALAGADDALVDRMAENFPRRVSRHFRRKLRELGPTRLSDVTAAQQQVAETAGRCVARNASRYAAAM